MQMRDVIVTPYDPQWPGQYEVERVRLCLALNSVLIASHHIGSTSVPGLAAKPVIDILLEVTELGELDTHSELMAVAGYEARGENGIAGRRYFIKGGDRRSHQVHAFNVGDEQIFTHLVFRDYLIENPKVAEAYAEVKHIAAATCDIKRYQELKQDFISHHLKQAMQRP
ncbi:GrpB family protein [Erwinia sp.]|uniref:GrpB family protein n=1 Tax=Erwinia citreus TaxID=558 RepID=UPI003C78C8B7